MKSIDPKMLENMFQHPMTKLVTDVTKARDKAIDYIVRRVAPLYGFPVKEGEYTKEDVMELSQYVRLVCHFNPSPGVAEETWVHPVKEPSVQRRYPFVRISVKPTDDGRVNYSVEVIEDPNEKASK